MPEGGGPRANSFSFSNSRKREKSYLNFAKCLMVLL